MVLLLTSYSGLMPTRHIPHLHESKPGLYIPVPHFEPCWVYSEHEHKVAEVLRRTGQQGNAVEANRSVLALQDALAVTRERNELLRLQVRELSKALTRESALSTQRLETIREGHAALTAESIKVSELRKELEKVQSRDRKLYEVGYRAPDNAVPGAGQGSMPRTTDAWAKILDAQADQASAAVKEAETNAVATPPNLYFAKNLDLGGPMHLWARDRRDTKATWSCFDVTANLYKAIERASKFREFDYALVRKGEGSFDNIDSLLAPQSAQFNAVEQKPPSPTLADMEYRLKDLEAAHAGLFEVVQERERVIQRITGVVEAHERSIRTNNGKFVAMNERIDMLARTKQTKKPKRGNMFNEQGLK